MLRKIVAVALLGSMSLGLAACGDDPGTRAVTGGLIGAGAGAGIAAVTGGRPATGALIGGGVGAVGGAVTTP
jgi:osmotically inducible lipoprotein OsmB